MPNLDSSALLTGLLSGIISSLLTYWGTRSKIRLDLTAELDKTLRDNRLKHYLELWPKTKDLQRYRQDHPFTREDVAQVSACMAEWYYGGGGIYLSERSRDPYFDLKKRMQEVIEGRENVFDEGGEMKLEVRQGIWSALNRLHAGLAQDLGGRKAPWL